MAMNLSPGTQKSQPILGKRAGRIDTAGVIIGFLPWLALAGWWLSDEFVLRPVALLSLMPCGLLALVSRVISRGVPSLALGAADVFFGLPGWALVWVVSQ